MKKLIYPAERLNGENLRFTLEAYYNHIAILESLDKQEEALVETMDMAYFGSNQEKALDYQWEQCNKKTQKLAYEIMRFVTLTADRKGQPTKDLFWINERESRRAKYLKASKPVLYKLAASL